MAEFSEPNRPPSVVDSEVDDVLSADPVERAHQLQLLREAFIPWLATIDGGNQYVHRAARWSQIPEASQPLVDALVARRILVKERRGAGDRGEVGEVFVEIAHRSLLHDWTELHGWLRERRHNLNTADDLQRYAAEWEAGKRDANWLMSGTRLIDAENLADTAEFGEQVAHTREYLKVSRRTENMRLENESQRHHDALTAAVKQLETARTQAAAAHEQALALGTRVRVLQVALVAAVIIALIAIIAAL
jgi:hypothetical protein